MTPAIEPLDKLGDPCGLCAFDHPANTEKGRIPSIEAQ